MAENPATRYCNRKSDRSQYFGTGLGIAVRPDNKALLAKLNGALKAIKADRYVSENQRPVVPAVTSFCQVVGCGGWSVGRVSAAPQHSLNGTKNLNRAPAHRLHQLIHSPCSSSIRLTINSPNPPRFSRVACGFNAEAAGTQIVAQLASHTGS